MAVYFKFKSAKDYDSVSIDGHFISVGNLKDKIVEKKNLGRGTDFDLLISNAQTDEEYTDEAQSIPRNTSVLVRRVPGRRQRPIVAEVRDEQFKDDVSMATVSLTVAPISQPKQVDESEWGDEFGVDLYAMPEPSSFQQLPALPQQQVQQQQQQIRADKLEEDSKIKAFVDASATDWQRQTQESLAAGKAFGRGQGRGFGARAYGRTHGTEKKVPPPGYICHRCGIAGHFIQHCSTNGDPAFDVKKMKPPTGIPKSMLVANPDGSYALPSGTVAILRPNEAVFEKEVEGLPSSKSLVDIPFELRCPLCKNVLKDAVLTSKCCFKSYCDKCIRDHILSNGKCVCGATNILADDLLPNKTLRDAITRLLETTSATSSAEHPGSLHVVQDMESAQRPKHRGTSPSASGSQLIKVRASSPSCSGSQKVGSAAMAPVSAGKAPSTQEKQQQSLVINITSKRLESIEQTAESISRQEPGSQDILGSQSNLVVEEEVQQETIADVSGKKRKPKPKRQKPLNGEKDGYYRNAGLYEPLLNGGAMPYPINPAPYGNYWPGTYMIDSFGQPILNPPYQLSGYGVPGPVPCDMLYGAGMGMPQYIGPTCISSMQAFQCDDNIMSREQFEARKAQLKKEFEQRVQKSRDDSKISGSEELGPSKLKVMTCELRVHFEMLMVFEIIFHVFQSRMAKVSSTVRSPSYDEGKKMEKLTRRKVPSSSPSPEPAKRKRHERREETPVQHLEDQTGFEANERPEKKPKASVFSRISFPSDSKDRLPKRLATEKFMDNKDEGASSSGSKGRRMPTTSPQDSVKLSGGRKSVAKDDHARLINRGVSKSKLDDEVVEAVDDDVYERNFRHRATHSSSSSRDVQDINAKNGKRRQL
ncbi:hypothetical protein KP509_39G057500 [Ceratopteris richardii]|uniref:DWNN domain-containing protein n=1 Tax=Ceratopteris richardii TaxID=49495 RepID=A0A8T2Q1N1_CERRI|nr:hypothetical protein KP509_39G057500 [Ceratopteris richardii]